MDEIVIMTNRSTNDVYTITKQQFINDVYDWVIKNNRIGFEIDW